MVKNTSETLKPRKGLVIFLCASCMVLFQIIDNVNFPPANRALPYADTSHQPHLIPTLPRGNVYGTAQITKLV